MRKTSYEYNKIWRKKHPDTWQQEKKKYYDQFDKNAVNSREPFTVDEINLIMAHSMPDRELSVKIGRTVRAIQAMRSKVKNGY